MGTLALLFPGQGSQSVGMGKALYEASPAARAVFDEADAALGFPLSRLCFEGPEEELKLTANTQPAILTHSVAAFEDLRARFPERLEGAAFAAGHSLGEYSANVAAGALAVRRRRAPRARARAVHAGGRARRASARWPRSWAWRPSEVEAACREAAQGEVVVAGQLQLARADRDRRARRGRRARLARPASRAGAKRAIPLPVSAPFHCALMSPARERMTPLLDAARRSPTRACRS